MTLKIQTIQYQLYVSANYHRWAGRIAALLTDDRVDELIVAQGQYQIGDIFLGTVENVLPGIDAAFINIDVDKNGFIHVSDLGPLRLKKGIFGITELLEPKQKVLVQVIKELIGSKGPRLTEVFQYPANTQYYSHMDKEWIFQEK